ncbi:sugar-binding transcriptional regulator [Paenibacillus borealis]|uniref:Cro/Cl family transcriptional regulator n=1 Tax=Paenibacillus borealis TaxID=160799 RepID=A0A089LF15_PAEBO|nr:sugar-binding transcriptional regulator [Paenibacillus borealis]AIQ60116.1 Cro/Cl family transcriptional regulator [Paenibacillus borealis]
MNEEEKKILVQVAKMYYLEDLTQSDISKRLGIYRTSISRLLKKARDEGIVQINIIDEASTHFEMENRLKQLFGLQEVIIVASHESMSGNDKIKSVGRAGAELLSKMIKDEDVVGFAWGRTMGSLIGEFNDCPQRSAHFVPLVGGPGDMETKYHVNAIVYSIATDFGGEAHMIDAAAVLERKETRNEIMNSNYFRKITELWDKLTVAVVGIGAPISNSNMIWTGFLGDKEIKHLNNHDAVGDICSRFYDSQGNAVNSELAERTIAIPLERLRDTRYTLALAESIEKAPSILGAIRGKYINALVTNEETAAEVLRLAGDSAG